MAQITKRNKKDGVSYLLRVSVGYDKNGRQVTRSKTWTPPPGLTGRKLDREVQRQAQVFEDAVRKGVLLDGNMKLDDLIERWFTQYGEKQLKACTVYDYRRLVPRISAAMGQMKVSQIRPAHLMQFYNELEKEGARHDSSFTAKQALLDLLPRGTRKDIARRAGVGERTMATLFNGGTVSRATAEKVAAAVGLTLSRAFSENVKAGGRLNGNTCKHYHRFLSSVFERAVKWQLIEENPCKRVESPKAAEVEVQMLDEEGVAHLLAALSDAPTQYSVLVQLALLTGARRGELCALRWSDIDLEKGTIAINRTLQTIPGKGGVFNAPKTRCSRRCIKVGPDCVALLTEYRQAQRAERFKIGSAWVRHVEIEGKLAENDLLFTRWNGAPIDPDCVSQWFARFVRKNGLSAVHFHSLRHSNASLMIAAHVPVTTVSGRLGHAQTSTTLNIYADCIRSSDAAAADALTDVFDRIREKHA